MTRVAIQGIKGSYSDEAVQQMFGAGVSVVECRDFAATFAAVDLGSADNAVVPVENKIVGPIAATADLLRAKRYRILKRLPLKIRHVLAGTPGAKFEDLVSVRSHIEALKQCDKFLASNPRLEKAVGSDTASSVRRIVEEKDPAAAAIGSRRAAELYGAEIIRENIADDIDNWTIFYLIGN
ncbi:MAG TPA: prephenate dehydratase domain-containing protein [Pyrinomonadaceae bacterium]|nr:prephenate dehydratase domain-containing protein [Pyrinomonadaceae bacterium]